MKRVNDNLKESASKRKKASRHDQAHSEVSINEWEEAHNFFKKQHFSLWDNWDVKTLLPGFTPNFKCKRKSKDKHSFIQVNHIQVALPNLKNNPKALLGKGGQGDVKLGMLASSEKVAIKVQKVRTDANIDPVKQEQKRKLRPEDLEAKILNHENLLLGELIRFPNKENPNSKYALKRYTVMKLVEGEDLDCVDVNKLSYKQRLTIAILCIENLKRIHAGNFVHGDIKPDNIKVKIDGDIISVQIIDFGLSIELPPGESQISIPFPFGNKEYIASELYNQMRIGYLSDIYSLGVVFDKVLQIDPGIIGNMTEHEAQDRPSLDEIDLKLKSALDAATRFKSKKRFKL
jgi:serine/threonine protein kinase